MFIVAIGVWIVLWIALWVAMALLDQFAPALAVNLDEPSSLVRDGVRQYQAPHDAVMMSLNLAGWRPKNAAFNA